MPSTTTTRNSLLLYPIVVMLPAASIPTTVGVTSGVWALPG